MTLKAYSKIMLLLMSIGLLSACTSNEVAENNQEKKKEVPQGVTFTINEPRINAKARRIVLSGDEERVAIEKTRTSIKHIPGMGAEAYWSEGDQIWVEDKNGDWQRSINTELHDGGASAEFTLPGTQSDYNEGCAVRYVGKDMFSPPMNGGNPEIAFTQPQITPNDFSKAGEYGDCGTGNAHATGNPRKWNFTLEHAVSYLCLLPRCENAALGQNTVLTNVFVEAADKAAGPDWLSVDGMCTNLSNGALNLAFYSPTASAYNSTATGVGGTVNNFPLTNTTTNAATNACYLMLLPGTHDLTVTYVIKDPSTNLSMTIEKHLGSHVYEPGKIYDITANLASSPLGKYYMWDAKQHYWWGYETEMPTSNGGYNPNFPKSDDPMRWYNPHVTGYYVRYDAQTPFFKTLPNANEISWYIRKGDAHWGSNGIGVINGHIQPIYGIWLKKKNKIIADEHITKEEMENWTYVGSRHIDRRNDFVSIGELETFIPSQDPVPNVADYFFLPALGYFDEGYLKDAGITGWYYSSSASPFGGGSAAYGLYFDKQVVKFNGAMRHMGLCAKAFE